MKSKQDDVAELASPLYQNKLDKAELAETLLSA